MTEGILVSCLSLDGLHVFTNLKDVLIKLLQKLDERVGLSKFVEIGVMVQVKSIGYSSFITPSKSLLFFSEHKGRLFLLPFPRIGRFGILLLLLLLALRLC